MLAVVVCGETQVACLVIYDTMYRSIYHAVPAGNLQRVVRLAVLLDGDVVAVAVIVDHLPFSEPFLIYVGPILAFDVELVGNGELACEITVLVNADSESVVALACAERVIHAAGLREHVLAPAGRGGCQILNGIFDILVDVIVEPGLQIVLGDDADEITLRVGRSIRNLPVRLFCALWRNVAVVCHLPRVVRRSLWSQTEREFGRFSEDLAVRIQSRNDGAKLLSCLQFLEGQCFFAGVQLLGNILVLSDFLLYKILCRRGGVVADECKPCIRRAASRGNRQFRTGRSLGGELYLICSLHVDGLELT